MNLHPQHVFSNSLVRKICCSNLRPFCRFFLVAMPAKAFASSASAAAANKDAALAKLQELLGRANSHELLDTLGTLVSSYVADAKDRIRKASVILKVVREKKRSLHLSETRAMAKAAKGEAKVLKLGDKAKAKILSKSAKNPTRGRPSKGVGECKACRYRAEGRAGGPAHNPALCAYTKALIRRESGV